MVALHDGTFAWPALEHARGTHELRILLGLVILVQGFETSRYLGSAYDARTRVRTMRWAQWLSTAIYLAFMLLITRYFSGDLAPEGGETAIIDMLAPLGALVMPVIIIMALASQLSAAVADTSGAGGLISESTGKRVPSTSATWPLHWPPSPSPGWPTSTRSLPTPAGLRHLLRAAVRAGRAVGMALDKGNARRCMRWARDCLAGGFFCGTGGGVR